MNRFLQSGRIGITGFTISFIGTLPFGVLNVLAFFITLSESFPAAFVFSIGVVLVELIYVALTLYGISRLRLTARSVGIIRIAMVGVILLVAFGSLQDAISGKPVQPVLPENIPRFLLGIGLSAVNALQIPFWMGWNTLLMEKKLLYLNRSCVIRYLSGIGAGTLGGLLVFMCIAAIAGEKAIDYLKEIKLCISFVLIATAIFMVCRLVYSSKDKLTDQPENDH